nr:MULTISPECIES: hypothetical protein [unclassified Frankia]
MNRRTGRSHAWEGLNVRLQVVDEDLQAARHDFSVDLIVTPTQIITCGPPRRPEGLYWNDLSDDTIAAIPVLAARRRRA